MSGRTRGAPPLFETAQPELRDLLARMRDEQEHLFLKLQSSEQHFRQLARSVWRVQEDERRRLARDLHDGIGQHLTALRHRLDVLEQADPPAPSALREAIALCTMAIEQTRAMSRLLRPQILDDLGLAAALHWLARQMQGEDRVVEVDVGTLPEPLDEGLATLVYRIAQEAFTNAVRHSRARSVVLRLAARGERLNLLIVDDGVGCDIAAALARSQGSDSMGLASIGERVRLFDGKLDLSSQPGEGFQLRVSLPLPAQAPP